MLMCFSGFSITLIVWMLWATTWPSADFALRCTGSFWSGFIATSRRSPPLLGAGPGGLGSQHAHTVHFPTHAGVLPVRVRRITPLLFLGGFVGASSSSCCSSFPVDTMVYCVNACLLWGGGFFARRAVDFSGGYVITERRCRGLLGAAIIGPVVADRENAFPSNLMLVAVGAGIIWLGWNGFNGVTRSTPGQRRGAVLNTNVAPRSAYHVLLMDMFFSKQRSRRSWPINGMLSDRRDHPSAGWVDVPERSAWPHLRHSGCSPGTTSPSPPFSKVDDALGVSTRTASRAHRVSGGLPGRPGDDEYASRERTTRAVTSPSTAGSTVIRSINCGQFWAVWIICWTATATR